MNFDYQFERLSSQLEICVTSSHKFGTDAFLLADFAAVKKKDTVCDLGTGCGIIPLLMIKNQQPKKIYAVDIQQQAIEQLQITLKHNQIQNIIPICEDLKNLKELPKASFDVVTCNPPYKANHTGILSQLSVEQIARHEVLCTMEDICQTASALLRFGGRFCLCQRPERLADVISAMKQAGIEPKRLRFVAKHTHQSPWLFLIEGRKGGKPFLKVLPTLAVYADNGTDFSEEMASIYHWDN